MSDFRGRGGRGGRGDFGGRGRGRGDSGGRGRGDFFDGRGGGRPQGGPGQGRGRGGDKFKGEDLVFRPRVGSQVPPVPKPDPKITQLENDILKKHHSDITTRMKNVQISGTPFPCRPAFGSQGKEVTLWANYFEMKLKAEILLNYTVDVVVGKDEKKPAGKKLYWIVSGALDQVSKLSKGVVYVTDFKQQVITNKPFTLPAENTVKVAYREEGHDDEFTVKFTKPINIDLPGLLKYTNTFSDVSEDAWPKFEKEITALTIITGFQARRNQKVAALGNRFFPLDQTDQRMRLDAIEFNRVIRGYFQSVRPATGRLVLNANVAHGVFRVTGPITQFINDQQHNYEQINRLLTKMKLRVRYKMFIDKNPENHRMVQKVVWGLATRGDGNDSDKATKPKLNVTGAKPNEVQFHLRAPAPAGFKADTFVYVKDYYKKRFNYDVNPQFPVINVGNKSRPVYVPAELVEIIDGQPLRRKTTGDETTGMINFSCRSPFANATSIINTGRQVLGLDGINLLEKFGVAVGKTLLTVHGRELTAPEIVYSDLNTTKPKTVRVNEGEWNMDSVRFTRPGRAIEKWAWVHIDSWNHRNHEQVKTEFKKWLQFMRSMGLSIADKPLNFQAPDAQVKANIRAGKLQDQLRPFFQGVKDLGAQYLFVVLSGKKTETEVYNAVKTLAESKHAGFGFITSCVVESNLLKKAGDNRGQAQLFANLGLKVNLKMGGANHKLKGEMKIMQGGSKTMFVGYDVVHPTNLKDAQGKPSLVALVASVGDDLAQWPATLWRQNSGVEMLHAGFLQKGFLSRLQLFSFKNNKKLPKNIVIFRDGVSEGQFQQVIDKELPAIREACVEAGYNKGQLPKITIIVSVKRHQTRFYPTDERNMVRSRNIKNGTVVDRGVTQANMWDFFLTAHKGLQGTSRPAHYTVLLDEVFRDMSHADAANDLEKLTYELCHLFGRATKAVSICPPAYYADIACTRSRVYLSDVFDAPDTPVAPRTSGQGKTQPAPPPPQEIELHDNLRDVMFYI
ncbi:ribonuclease H-like domain-containing protein [Xylariaceae sp. FL1019]|nr:ribonuclease H-like domain-containing protein [Xylariaceae sp. FL1019]